MEKYISDEHPFVKASDLKTGLLVDFMSLIRRLPLGQMLIFKDLLQATLKNAKNVCDFQRIDIVFDSYKSSKEVERHCRMSSEPSELMDSIVV